MERWKQDFIIGLKQGKPVDMCARVLAGLPLSAVQAERESDPSFAAAWDAALPLEDVAMSDMSSARALTPAALEALMWAQCDDEEAAAYFGMEVGEFKGAIAADPALTKTYRIGPLGGRAALKRSQFEGAMSGDRTMQTWLGKQHLGQSDKVEQTITRKDDDTPDQLARKLLYIMAQTHINPLDVIDGDIVADSDQAPVAISHTSHDTDTGGT